MTSVQKTSGLEVRRAFPIHRRGSVCRNLFGPVDHEELSRELKAKLREISERDQCRWNFNFETNTPLPGSYEWEEMSPCSTPVFYQESTQGGGRVVAPNADFTSEDSVTNVHACCPSRNPQSNCEETLVCPVELNQENCSNISNTGMLTSELTPIRRKRTSSGRTIRPNNVTQITGRVIIHFYWCYTLPQINYYVGHLNKSAFS